MLYIAKQQNKNCFELRMYNRYTQRRNSASQELAQTFWDPAEHVAKIKIPDFFHDRLQWLLEDTDRDTLRKRKQFHYLPKTLIYKSAVGAKVS